MDEELPIIQYWHSSELPAYIAEATASFARHNPSRPHRVFHLEEARNVIDTAFGEQETAAFDACAPPAMQADYWRYLALLRFGGVWADASFSCVGDVTSLLGGSAEGELFGTFAFNPVLMNGLMAFNVPGHPFLRLAADLSTELIARRWEGKVNEVTGSMIITTINRLHVTGSTDAFLREMRAVQEEVRSKNLLPYARLVCELVGDYRRVTTACEGIRVSPASCMLEWIRSPRVGVPHRESTQHWSRLGTNIYTATAG